MKNEQEIKNTLIAKASEDAEFRARLLDNPHAAVEAGVGITIPANISLTVHEESPTSLHLVVPFKPASCRRARDGSHRRGLTLQR